MPKLKSCNTCRRELPTTHFYKNNQQSDGLTGKCRDCMAIVRKEWDRKYNKSPKARATADRYYYSEKGQSTKKAYRESYELSEEQRERYRIAQRKHEKEARYKVRRKRYDQSEKGKATKAKIDKRHARTDKGRFTKRKIEIKRKHQIASGDCTLTLAQWQEIKARFQKRCAYCGEEKHRLEKDHVKALSKGGTHTAANIVPACRTCNAKKGDRPALGQIAKT